MNCWGHLHYITRKPANQQNHDLELIDEIVEVTASAIEAREEDFKKMVRL